MSLADSYQVGGEHYKSGYDHWNLVRKVGLNYFEGCTTKYVARFGKKQKAIEDLQKARHYLAKLREQACAEEYQLALNYRPTVAEIMVEVVEFSKANQLLPEQTLYTWVLCTWSSVGDLDAADRLLMHMLAVRGIDGAAPVPLTEENHHAERAREPLVPRRDPGLSFAPCLAKG